MSSSLASWIQNFNPDGTPRPKTGPNNTRGSIGGVPVSGAGAGFASKAPPAPGAGRSGFGIGMIIPPGPALEAESGRLPPPARAAEAAAQTPLNSPQQAMAIGEPIPVVFCRRRDNIGGVLLFPKATEAAFSNTSTQQTSRYHCVLGVGPMGSIQTRDFRVGACRVGTFSQNYDKRAGTWTPGNTATVQSGYQVPTFPTACGGGGAYTGLSTLEFSSTTTGGSDDWRLGCNVFVREGLTVTRLLGGSGASDNFADLLLWALQRSSRVPAAMIDTASFTAAARFLDVNGLLCNGEFVDSENLGDFMVRMLPYFLLRETRIGGKYGLRPLVPINTDGTIDTGTLAPDWVLTESVILPGSFSQEWSDAGTRLGPRLVMMWRQQDDTSLPIVRTLHVGLDRPGPPEQHDLSRFCTSEIHAARVGTYLHGRRYLSTHSAGCTLLPGSQTGRISQGDVMAVNLPLITGREADGAIADWYAVESVTPAADGSEALTLSHFPVDSIARSLLALEVANATAPGSLLPFPPIGACDLAGRSTDQTVPASTTSGTPFTQWGGGMTIGAGTATQGSAGGGTYDAAMFPDDAPKAEEAPKQEPPVNPAIPGGLPVAPENPINPDPEAFAEDCPNGTQQVTVRIHHAALSLSPPVPTHTDVATRWGAISVADTPASNDPVILNRVSYQDLDGNYINGTVFYSTRVVSNPISPWNSVDVPFWLETISIRCDLGGGTPGPPITTRRYTVGKGDTLYNIAAKTLGDPSRWPEIHALNPEISNPDLIYPGQVLKVPVS